MWIKIKRNLGLKILSVVIAVVAWFIVTVYNNPVEVKDLSIPLTIVNERNITLRGLQIVEGHDPYIDIQIKGATNEVAKVSVADFYAYVDYTEIAGENTTFLRVKEVTYNGKANVTFSYEYEDSRKDIKVERLVSSEFPVAAEFSGQLPEGYVLVAHTVTPNIQSVNDVSSMISNIGSIKVEIDLDNAVQSFVIRKSCNVYDKQSNIINEYANAITVDVSVIIGKQVDIVSHVIGTGNLGEDHVYVSNTLEYNQALLVGDAAVLRDITVIHAKELNIAGKTGSFSEDVEVEIPANTRLYTNDNELNVYNKVKLYVNIEQLITKKFDFGIQELLIRNKNVLQEYTINQNEFSVILKGRAATLGAITKSQVTPYIDVLNISDGMNSIKANIVPLSSNISISDSTAIEVFVESIASYLIATDRVVLANIDNLYSYDIQADTFTLRLIGHSADIAEADVSEMKFFVDVAGMSEGMHLIDVIVRDGFLPDDVRIYDEIKIAVMISAQ